MLDVKTSGLECTNALRQAVYRERDLQLASHHHDICVGVVRLRCVTDNAGRPKYACELDLKLRHTPDKLSVYCMDAEMEGALRHAFSRAARALRRKLAQRRARHAAVGLLPAA